MPDNPEQDAPETPPEPETPADTETVETGETAAAKPTPPEVDWKAKARDWEKRAKANADAAKRLEQIEEQQKTAEQKAADAAEKAEDRAADALRRIARAEVKAALTGVVPDPENVIEDLNLSRFVSDDGEVDPEAVAALREKYSKLAPPPGSRAPAPNPAQGSSGNGQLSITQQVEQARKDGDWRKVIELNNQKLADLATRRSG